MSINTATGASSRAYQINLFNASTVAIAWMVFVAYAASHQLPWWAWLTAGVAAVAAMDGKQIVSKS